MSLFYKAMQREPGVIWSCFIGALGADPPPQPLNQRRLPARGFPDRRARSTARRATRALGLPRF